MRKRSIRFDLRLNENENDCLELLARKAGVTKSNLLRCMILGYQLCEKPDPEFYAMQKELSAIGNRIDQLARKANAIGFIDAPMLAEESKRWRAFRLDISRRFLRPRKVS